MQRLSCHNSCEQGPKDSKRGYIDTWVDGRKTEARKQRSQNDSKGRVAQRLWTIVQ